MSVHMMVTLKEIYENYKMQNDSKSYNNAAKSTNEDQDLASSIILSTCNKKVCETAS